MTYYKIFDGKAFYGVGTTNELRRYQTKHRLVVLADENNAEFIAVGNEFYRGEWMKPVPDGFTAKECTVEAITKKDYNALKEAIDKDEAIKPEPKEPEEEEESAPEPEVTADALREMKIREMSLACNQAITEGFGVELGDGNLHHFSLTMQDQMNLISVQTQILAGATEVPYHADGEDADMFSAVDMATVIAAANAHKTYHFPKKYQTALLKKLRP